MIRLLMALSALCLLLAAAPALAQAELAGVVDQTANLRAAPDPRALIVGQLPAGALVTLTGRDAPGRWLHAVSADQLAGWLPVFVVITEADILRLPVLPADSISPGAEVMIEAFGRVNVRSAPAVTAEILGQLDGGERLPVLGRDSEANDWLLIALPEAPQVEGWVAYFTVGVQGDPDTLPLLAVDAGHDVQLPEALVNTRFNTRLHAEPALTSPTLIVVDFGQPVEPLARTADGAWLYVRYVDVVGWGAARLFDLTRAQANSLPVFMPLTSPTQSATPAATAEAGG